MLAADFHLPDQNNKFHRLSDYRGKWVVLYFYPKDDTPGCTKEACNFRDNFHELSRGVGSGSARQKKDVVVLGVSKDSVASHKKFAGKYDLNFPLLSDENKETIQAYDAWGKKKFLGKEFEGILRTTYIIGPDGEVRKKYENVNPTQHAQEILTDLQTLQQ